ncbi:MAG TPA: helix-hairpin-helix domain-containing protein [Segeticoccus sp.]|nr:helix-hairpin-helix domain-containing protein [Segeticoccus sp.]
MPRRHLDLPPPHRLAAVLGLPTPPAGAPGEASSPTSVASPAAPREDGWVPTRESVVPTPEPDRMPRARLPRLRRRPARPPGRHRAGRRPGPAERDRTAAADDEEGEPVDRPPRPGVVTVPASLVDVRAHPRVAAVVGVAAVLLLAAALFGVRVLLARQQAAPQPVAAVTAATGEPTPGGSTSGVSASGGAAGGSAGADAAAVPAPTPTPSASGSGSASTPAAAAVLLVHVVGQVRHPGVVRLREGDRVQDAVEAAGGATRHADLGAVNLARPVADGEQVRIPKPGERSGPPPGAAGGAGGVAGAGAVGTGPGAAGTTEPPVDLNAATAEQLETLPGVGPVLAQRILEWRTAHGRFSSVEELLEVSGIGDKTFADLQPRVTV